MGFPDLRRSVPRIMLERINPLDASTDPMAAALFTCPSFDHLGGRLVALTGDTPPAHYWRAAIGDHTSTKGLETASEDSASRSWIFRGPYGWSGKDFVRAIHLRTGNLPTRAIPSNPPEERLCRGGCGKQETLAHILQRCPVVQPERIRRHNEVARKIAKHCRSRSWVVEEEPHVRHPQGQLFKPDLVVHRQGLPSVVCDVQVSWDGYEPLAEAWRNKSLTYDPPPSALQRRDVGPERPLFISRRFSEPEAFGLVVMR